LDGDDDQCDRREQPPPAPVNGPSNHFAVSVPVVLPYDQAAKLALEALQKNPPRAGSKRRKM